MTETKTAAAYTAALPSGGTLCILRVNAERAYPEPAGDTLLVIDDRGAKDPSFRIVDSCRIVRRRRKRDILRAYFVDSQLLHFVDVAGYDGLNEKLCIYVHRKYLVIFSSHNYGTFSTVDFCIKVVFSSLRGQPREESAACTVFLRTQRSPSKHFAVVYDFGNYGNLSERES